MTGTGGLQRVPRAVVESYKIPLPSLVTQQAIVAEIEAEQKLVAANRELICRFEKKIQATLARIWGEGSDTVRPELVEGLPFMVRHTHHERTIDKLTTNEELTNLPRTKN